MHVLRLFDSPVEFFRARWDVPPRWHVALFVLLLAMVVDTTPALMLVNRLAAELLPNQDPPPVLVALGILSAVSVFSLFFWIAAIGAAMAEFVILQSDRAHRLVEFTALAYVVLLPWALVKLGIVFLWPQLDISLALYMFWVIDWFVYLWIVALLGGALYAGRVAPPAAEAHGMSAAAWKMIDVAMMALSIAALVASLAGWWHQVFPWFTLVQVAWNISLMRRRGHEPYPTASKWLSETAAAAATPQTRPAGTRRTTPARANCPRC